MRCPPSPAGPHFLRAWISPSHWRAAIVGCRNIEHNRNFPVYGAASFCHSRRTPNKHTASCAVAGIDYHGSSGAPNGKKKHRPTTRRVDPSSALARRPAPSGDRQRSRRPRILAAREQAVARPALAATLRPHAARNGRRRRPRSELSSQRIGAPRRHLAALFQPEALRLRQ